MSIFPNLKTQAVLNKNVFVGLLKCQSCCRLGSCSKQWPWSNSAWKGHTLVFGGITYAHFHQIRSDLGLVVMLSYVWATPRQLRPLIGSIKKAFKTCLRHMCTLDMNSLVWGQWGDKVAAIKVDVREADGLVAFHWVTSMARGVNGTSDTPGALTIFDCNDCYADGYLSLTHTLIHTQREYKIWALKCLECHT